MIHCRMAAEMKIRRDGNSPYGFPESTSTPSRTSAATEVDSMKPKLNSTAAIGELLDSYALSKYNETTYNPAYMVPVTSVNQLWPFNAYTAIKPVNAIAVST